MIPCIQLRGALFAASLSFGVLLGFRIGIYQVGFHLKGLCALMQIFLQDPDNQIRLRYDAVQPSSMLAIASERNAHFHCSNKAGRKRHSVIPDH